MDSLTTEKVNKGKEQETRLNALGRVEPCPRLGDRGQTRPESTSQAGLGKNWEGWIRGVVEKHSLDALAVFAALLKAGLANGECSANDIPEGVAEGSNVRGACFKLLRGAGFVKSDRIAKSTGRRRHAGLILIWTLDQRWLAEMAQQKVAQALLTRKPKGIVTQAWLRM